MNTITGHCCCDVHKPWGYADTVSRETETSILHVANYSINNSFFLVPNDHLFLIIKRRTF